ncbi:PPE domain-containing protein, partial [Mycobacterium avium]|uniref:PPE domain-containing protein n=1 Tax=Mycobacterium avium TaxID=1764 RepID=UPI0012DA7A81
PGPGPLLASAGAWRSLRTPLHAAPSALTALLDEGQAGAREGANAPHDAAAPAGYLARVEQATADTAPAVARADNTPQSPAQRIRHSLSRGAMRVVARMTSTS